MFFQQIYDKNIFLINHRFNPVRDFRVQSGVKVLTLMHMIRNCVQISSVSLQFLRQPFTVKFLRL